MVHDGKLTTAAVCVSITNMYSTYIPSDIYGFLISYISYILPEVVGKWWKAVHSHFPVFSSALELEDIQGTKHTMSKTI